MSKPAMRNPSDADGKWTQDIFTPQSRLKSDSVLAVPFTLTNGDRTLSLIRLDWQKSHRRVYDPV